jgi:nucleoside-diphosphate-sugar epimerase
VSAKLLAAGGGDVVITYSAGHDDAQAVAQDINHAGRGRCEVRQADLSQPFQGLAGLDPASLDAVYYFATPRIYNKRNEVFNRAAFDEFTGFYLQRFDELCRWLEAAQREPALKVYLPSTVFIAERPKGMTEYAMAKAAAELLADDLNRSLQHVRIVHTRLPRLATDQTSAIMTQASASNLEVMTAVLRLMAG